MDAVDWTLDGYLNSSDFDVKVDFLEGDPSPVPELLDQPPREPQASRSTCEASSTSRLSRFQQLPAELWPRIFSHAGEDKASLRLACKAADEGFCQAQRVLSLPAASICPSPLRYTNVTRIHLPAKWWGKGLWPADITGHLSSLLSHTWPNVHTLVSHGCSLDAASIIILAFSCPQLKSLHLCLAPIGQASIDTLATAAQYLPSLTALDLSRPGMLDSLHPPDDIILESPPLNPSTPIVLPLKTDPAQLQALAHFTAMQSLTLKVPGNPENYVISQSVIHGPRRAPPDLAPLAELPSLSTLTLIFSQEDQRFNQAVVPLHCSLGLPALTSLTSLKVLNSRPGYLQTLQAELLFIRPHHYPALLELSLEGASCLPGPFISQVLSYRTKSAPATVAAGGAQAGSSGPAQHATPAAAAGPGAGSNSRDLGRGTAPAPAAGAAALAAGSPTPTLSEVQEELMAFTAQAQLPLGTGADHPEWEFTAEAAQQLLSSASLLGLMRLELHRLVATAVQPLLLALPQLQCLVAGEVVEHEGGAAEQQQLEAPGSSSSSSVRHLHFQRLCLESSACAVAIVSSCCWPVMESVQQLELGPGPQPEEEALAPEVISQLREKLPNATIRVGQGGVTGGGLPVQQGAPGAGPAAHTDILHQDLLLMAMAVLWSFNELDAAPIHNRLWRKSKTRHPSDCNWSLIAELMATNLHSSSSAACGPWPQYTTPSGCRARYCCLLQLAAQEFGSHHPSGQAQELKQVADQLKRLANKQQESWQGPALTRLQLLQLLCDPIHSKRVASSWLMLYDNGKLGLLGDSEGSSDLGMHIHSQAAAAAAAASKLAAEQKEKKEQRRDEVRAERCGLKMEHAEAALQDWGREMEVALNPATADAWTMTGSPDGEGAVAGGDLEELIAQWDMAGV